MKARRRSQNWMVVLSFALYANWGGSIRTNRLAQVKYYLEPGQGINSPGSQFVGIQTAYNKLTMA
jgi:hypothetical protein